jgi:hypothetical protein
MCNTCWSESGPLQPTQFFYTVIFAVSLLNSNYFVLTGSVETRKLSGRPKVIEDVVENIRDDLF